VEAERGPDRATGTKRGNQAGDMGLIMLWTWDSKSKKLLFVQRRIVMAQTKILGQSISLFLILPLLEKIDLNRDVFFVMVIHAQQPFRQGTTEDDAHSLTFMITSLAPLV
jgi:hypothetical protein